MSSIYEFLKSRMNQYMGTYKPGKSQLDFQDEKSYMEYLKKSRELYPEHYEELEKEDEREALKSLKIIEEKERIEAEKKLKIEKEERRKEEERAEKLKVMESRVMTSEENVDVISDYLKYNPSYVMCDLAAIFKDIKMLKSNSSSPSIQFLAQIKPQSAKPLVEYYKKHNDDKVFIKMYPYSDYEEETRFELERAIYQYLNKYVAMNNIPNIVRYIMSFACDSGVENTGDYDDGEWDLMGRLTKIDNENKNEDDENKSFFDIKKVRYLVLERVKGTTLDKYMYKNFNPEYKKYLPSIIFQIVYTLSELNYQKIRHNDCHSGNWFIEEFDKETELFYFINEKTYFRIVTKFWVKLHDFDLSTSTDNKFVSKIYGNMCPDYGICTSENQKFDLFIILSELERLNLKNLEIGDWFTDFIEAVILDDRLFDGSYCCVYPGRLCKHEGECEKELPPGDSELLGPKDSLLLDEMLYKNQVERYELKSWPWKKPTTKVLSLNSIPSNELDMRLYASTSIQSSNPVVKISNTIINL